MTLRTIYEGRAGLEAAVKQWATEATDMAADVASRASTRQYQRGRANAFAQTLDALTNTVGLEEPAPVYDAEGMPGRNLRYFGGVDGIYVHLADLAEWLLGYSLQLESDHDHVAAALVAKIGAALISDLANNDNPKGEPT